MARPLRICQPGLIYHVINRGNNRQAVFLEEADYRLYLDIVYRYKRKFDFKLFAFCLMTNHIHLLIQVGVKGTISQIMQSITVAHTRHYHNKYQTGGHIWQGRFKSPLVSDDEYLLRAMIYIEQNPLRAKMVKKIADYPWSSYRLNVREKESLLIDRKDNPILAALGKGWSERTEKYKYLTGQPIQSDEQEKIRLSLTGGSHYISGRFKERIEEMLPEKRPPGRPRKRGKEEEI